MLAALFLVMDGGYTNMKIAILSRNPRLYSTRREAAEERGHSVEIFDVLRC